jgi:hypothetical protein
MRTELPRELQHEVDAARADLLLAPPSAEGFALLEAWGFDDEAVAMWSRLGFRARRAARRMQSGRTLASVRADVVRLDGRTVDAFPGFRSEWLGHSLAVHDAPTPAGRVSFALRWHAARPALLWDVPRGLTVRASALDNSFASSGPVGETLLAEPPAPLLAMRSSLSGRGVAAEAPEQFT